VSWDDTAFSTSDRVKFWIGGIRIINLSRREIRTREIRKTMEINKRVRLIRFITDYLKSNKHAKELSDFE
jgi:hypothetical protein